MVVEMPRHENDSRLRYPESSRVEVNVHFYALHLCVTMRGSTVALGQPLVPVDRRSAQAAVMIQVKSFTGLGQNIL
jgi:hypothetical protein